ncbi:MAG: AEC family transporter [Pseudomonadota bacterium]
MSALLEVIVPVFLVIGAGYAAVWAKLFTDEWVDGLMIFTQRFAIPCLLFAALSRLDLGQEFDWRLLTAFYVGMTASFFAGVFGARRFFARPWTDAVAIGFACMFSNTVLLGLPITERAYGAEALTGNYAIIALHAPFGYALGITAMEIARAGGGKIGSRAFAANVLGAMFSNALIIGIALGLAVNLSGVTLPGPVTEALDLMVRAALPAALFGLGGVLYRYRPEGDLRQIAWMLGAALVLHASVTSLLGLGLGLSTEALRSAVVTSAMPPGVNAYIFANIYGVAKRVCASAVLMGTALSLLTIWAWLAILP